MEQQVILFVPARIPESLIQQMELIQKPTIAISLFTADHTLTCPALERHNLSPSFTLKTILLQSHETTMLYFIL